MKIVNKLFDYFLILILGSYVAMALGFGMFALFVEKAWNISPQEESQVFDIVDVPYDEQEGVRVLTCITDLGQIVTPGAKFDPGTKYLVSCETKYLFPVEPMISASSTAN